MVLGDASQQLWAVLFILGRFSLIGLGLGLDNKWARVPRSFGPTIVPKNPAVRLLGQGGGF